MDPIAQAQEALANSHNIIVLAGAGMSADLGVPVYYSGSESKYGSSVSTYGYTAFEHANASMWEIDPKNQMLYVRESWRNLLKTDPGHTESPYKVLFDWIKQTGKDYFIATSNVDGAFARTGYDEDKLYEIHGSYRFSQCLNSSYHGIYPTTDPEAGYTFCPRCISYSRPNTLYFDDFSFNDDYSLEQQDNFMRYLQAKKAAKEKTVILEIGAGETVSTLRNYAQEMSMFYKFPVIRINPDDDTIKFRTKGRAGKPNGEFVHIKENATAALKLILKKE